MGVRDRVGETVDGYQRSYIEQVREKWRDRWVEYTHELRPDYPQGEYDLSIPEIHIEWLLCDLYNLRLVKSKRHRAEWYAKLTPEELDVWFNREDPDGARYCDLEKGSFARAVRKETKEQKRGK